MSENNVNSGKVRISKHTSAEAYKIAIPGQSNIPLILLHGLVSIFIWMYILGLFVLSLKFNHTLSVHFKDTIILIL